MKTVDVDKPEDPKVRKPSGAIAPRKPNNLHPCLTNCTLPLLPSSLNPKPPKPTSHLSPLNPRNP